MKKLWLSLAVIILTVGIVSGTAFAVFSNKAEVKGLTMSTGNADLKIGWNGQEVNSVSNYGHISDMYPGFIVGDKFRLINKSDSDISLDITAILKDVENLVDGSWGELKYEVEAAVIEYVSNYWAEEDVKDNKPGGNVASDKFTANTGWQHLQWWRNNNPQISSDPIAKDEEGHFVLWIKVLDTAGNDIADKKIDAEVEFTGTQAL